MKIEVRRKIFTDKSTIGELYIDGVFECYTLEDKVREEKGKSVKEWKIPAITAIPMGIYKVIISLSTRFKKDLPLLLNVEGFEGVRIHPGNTDENTEGCILVGNTLAKDFIGDSRKAFDKLFEKIKKVVDDKKEITIEIKKASL